MKNFKQEFIDTAYSKFGIKANGSINFEQAFAIIDEIEQCNIANVVEQGKRPNTSSTLECFTKEEKSNCKCGLPKEKKCGSLSLETIVDYVTNKDLSIHNKICNLWLKSGNKVEDFPELPPCWFAVEITLKNGKKYKSMLVSINNRGGAQFIINRTFKKRIYLNTDEVVSWEFI